MVSIDLLSAVPVDDVAAAKDSSMKPTPDMIIDHSLEAIDRKMFGHADTILRQLIKDNGPKAECYTALAQLLFSVGEHEVAKRMLREALNADATFTPARQGLKKMGAPRKSVDELANPEKRFLLIRAWGQGFWSDVSHVVGACLLAEHTNRTPVVWWGPESRYRPEGEIDAWPRYFEPVSGATIEQVQSQKTFWPPKWNGRNVGGGQNNLWEGPHSRVSIFDLMNRAEDVVVADFHVAPSTVKFYLREDHPLRVGSVKDTQRALLKKYVRPTSEIRGEVEAWIAKHGEPTAAIHLRSTDKVVEDPQLGQLHAKAREWAKEFVAKNPGKNIFVLTDAKSIAEAWKAKFGGAVLLCDVIRSEELKIAAHFQNHDGGRLGREILVESLIALRAGFLMGSINSNVTNMIFMMKEWPLGSTVFTGEDQDEMVNELIFDPGSRPLAQFEQKKS